jgi:hypothetical protein
VLIAWWLLLGGHLAHLASGSISLAVAVEAGAFALNTTGMLRH